MAVPLPGFLYLATEDLLVKQRLTRVFVAAIIEGCSPKLAEEKRCTQ